MRFAVDASWQRFGSTVLAGSPLRLFRLAGAGTAVVERIERGEPFEEVPAAGAPGIPGLLDRLLDAGAIHPSVAPIADTDAASTDDTRHSTGATSNGDVPRFTVDDVTVVTPQLGGVVADDDRVTVDDGSVPPLANATLRLDHNAGPGAARNAGRRLVTTGLIAFVDADVDLPDGWLDHLVPHFSDPAVGLVAPRVAGEVGSPLDLDAAPARVRAGTRVSYVPAAAVVVRASAFDDVGGFDPGLRFGEDVDLVWRLDEAGWRCRYEPVSVVEHRPRPTFSARFRQHAAYGSSAAPLALRHPHALAPYRSNGWTATAWALVALARPVGMSGAVSVVATSSLALPARLPDVPRTAAVHIALRGHVLAGEQVASAMRRAWWPIVLVAAIVSRRVRWIGVAALALGGRSSPTDLAYGWGLWRGMWRHRTWRPIVPEISSWPGRSHRFTSARPRHLGHLR